MEPMWNYYAHTQGGEAVLKWNYIHENEDYAIVIRECNKERQSFRIETLAQG
jgi:hypothetical protein